MPRRPNFRPHVIALAAASVLGAFAATPAAAANCTWNPAAGNWNNPAAWSCGVVPRGPALDAAIIAAGKTVTINDQESPGVLRSIYTLGNAGTLQIDAFGLTLQGGGSTTNTGTINVGGASTAALQVGAGHNIDNTVGVINIASGSVLNQFGSTISGGTINSSGTGKLTALASGNNFLNGVTFNGALDMASGNGIERISGGLTLNGTIAIGAASILAAQGNQTIGGSGSIVFADGNASNRLNTEAGNLTLGAGITVHGQTGYIGQQSFVGGAATLTNNGSILADVSGGIITLAVNGGVTNNGTLGAANGGTLLLNSAITNNAGSQITATSGGTVVQNGVALNGTINVASGAIAVAANGNNILNGVNFTGVLDLASANAVERVAGGLTLANGSVVRIGNNSIFAPQGNQTIAPAGGAAEIVFTDANASNRLNVEAGTLTLGAGMLVHGNTGYIGQQNYVGGAAALVNNGSILADVGGGTITLQINGGGGVTNNGTLGATNGGTLLLNSNIHNASGAQILAGAGSTVVQNGVALDGTINVVGGGSFRASANGGNFLNGATFNGVLDLASANAIERVAGGLTLNGTVNIAKASILAPQGDQTIGGTGSIVFADNNASNRFNTEAGNLTLGSGITVRGDTGYIGQQTFVGGAATLTNNGSILADVGGGTITLAVNGGVTNNGTLGAANGGTLLLNSNIHNASGAQILAGAGSTVIQNGVALDGTINVVGGGSFRASANGGNFLNGATFNGVLDLASATSIERVAGGLTLNGSIDIAKASILAPQGNQTIGGTGTINFADANASNRLNVEAGNLVLGAGVTVQGVTGYIGQQTFVGGAATLTNNGTINSNGGGTITVAVSGAVTNNGLMRAQNGALNIANGLAGTGTLQVDAAGSMALANVGNTQGKLVMGAAGSAINIGTGNLTINTDYTNAAAGAGNGFNRRAGVSGTGQIVAGGDVSQVISGAGVSNGNTNNATLTIGNVRVGANTFNYQIGNAGSTGPTLRGAIQTAAGGGNLTDARLSGSGVAASNYNAGAPGANSGDLAVVFNAASAGLLAPLAGQVLNLRSNFENIADQKLNIVLAGGAAAYNAAVGAATPAPVVIANQRVGGSGSQALTVSNTAAAHAYSEDLRASFGANTGAATNNGASLAQVLAGASNNATMAVGVDTATAGAKSGTVTLNYQTAGAVNGVSNGLGVAGANAPQTINVSGKVYQAASGAIQTPALNFGNVQVGQAVTQNLVIRNTAAGAAGYVEDLNASFATGVGTDARISGSGSLTGILAGQNSSGANGAMQVAINTGSAGAVNGTIRVNYATAGAVNGVSNGLGTAAAGFEDYAAAGTIVQGNVIDQAKPVINGVANPGAVTVNLGNVRIGGAAGQALNVLNQATGNQQGALNASIASNGAPVTAAGSFNGLAAGATSNALQVGIDTSVAGARSGSATVSLVSDITSYGNCAPNCTLNLANQTVNVSANVFRLASGSASPVPVDLGAFRVGIDTPAGKGVAVANTAANDGFSEQLGIGSVSSGNALFTAANALGAGRVNAGSSAAGAIGVGAGAGLVAGINNGTVTVQYVSDGTASGSGGAINANSQQFNVTAKGYTAAAGQLNAPASIDFGTVRVGTAVAAQTLTISNVAQTTALNDTLKGTLAVAGAGFSGNGSSVAGLVAGGAGGALQVGFDTSSAGVKNGSAQVAYVSHNPDMIDYALGNSQSVALAGTVNALADAMFAKSGGSANFNCVGGVCTLDLGTLQQGSGISSDTLQLRNAVPGPADDLVGSFDFSGFAGFGSSGFGAVDLAGGAAMDGLTLSLDTTSLGNFSSSFWFNGFSHNAFQSDYALAAIRFVVEGIVVAQGGGNVPEPGTLGLLAAAGLAGWATRRRGLGVLRGARQ